jgi:hypothetical protein
LMFLVQSSETFASDEDADVDDTAPTPNREPFFATIV